MEAHHSARSARSRTQVGTTNRSSTLSSVAAKEACRVNVGGRASGSRRGSLTSVTPPQSTGEHPDGSARRASLTSSRSQRSVGDDAKESMSTSRSMPSLGTSRDLGGGLDSRGGQPENDDSVQKVVMAMNAVQEKRPRPQAEDFYMSSTQMAYMSGLQAPESKIPVVDPYLHRGRLHDRWINRASQRLGDLATLKYGSIKEFFRLYDANCDGVLDFDEFSKGITMCQLDHLFPRSLQRTLFDRIDGDKSGSIELDEFVKFLGRGVAQGAPADEVSVWQQQEQKRKADDLEARSVQLLPIHDHKTERIKNKLSHCLNKAVPNASPGLADDRSMYLKKQFAFLTDKAGRKGVGRKDLVRALGPKGMNVGVDEDELQALVKEMDTNDDGTVTLKEFAAFINLDDHEPLYQPLFDGRRRNVNILQATVDGPPPVLNPEEEYVRFRADQLHSVAVPSRILDVALREERSIRESSAGSSHVCRSVRPESPPWTVGYDPITFSTPSGQTVVDVWNLPPPTRHLSSTKRSLTSSMRYLPRTFASRKDGADVSYASDGGPFAAASPLEALPTKKKALSSLSSSEELFSSLQEAKMQEANASALARSRKVAKPTWADIGHGGTGDDAGVDDSSSFYACPGERFTTTNSERYAPLIKEKKIEKGQRSAWFYRERPGDSAAEASRRLQKSEDHSLRIKTHLERISLGVKAEEVALKLKGERRVRGKARTRLRYSKWVNSLDNWMTDEVPKLADFDKRQFPQQNVRQRGGAQVHEALGGPMAIAV